MLIRSFVMLLCFPYLFAQQKGPVLLPNPIIFATQVPVPADFTTIGSTFGNHLASMSSVARGGDLYIRYPDGTLKNLTQAAGYGETGHQGAAAIAVRDPCVHWDGQRVLFSMVIGAPEQFVYNNYYWQLYEITNLGPTETPQINLVPNQPQGYNNVQAIYGSDDRIIFVCDRPRDGRAHLYPLLDEYEEAPTPTGLWSLDPSNGDLFLLNHTPSGAFNPTLDHQGRVIFTRWDHLQRDQQADADALSSGGSIFGTFNYADESANAARLPRMEEQFPEPRSVRIDLLAGTNLEGHSFNHFFPWEIHQDGSAEEMLNHIGRHELVSYFNRVFNDDPNLVEFISANSGRLNLNDIRNFFTLHEDPSRPGMFVGIDAPEFSTHCSGQMIAMMGPGGTNPDQMTVEYLTHRATADFIEDGAPLPVGHSGLYRDPVFLLDGTLLAVHTAEARADLNEGSRANPSSRYDFRVKQIEQQGAFMGPGQAITPGVSKAVTYYDPDVLVSYSGPLWELYPVELTAKSRPPQPTSPVPALEQQVFTDENVDLEAFRSYLRERQLALLVSRDVTTRDGADGQQPYNLRVEGTTTQTTGSTGTLYDVAFLQFFQADHLRGLGGTADPNPGRRVLATQMHDSEGQNPDSLGGPAGSVRVASDGSMAAIVPARRAMTWQLTHSDFTPVVRERFWLTFQPGEVRVCASCHGVNTTDQAGNPPPENPPLALRELLNFWKRSVCEPGPRDLNNNSRSDVGDGVLLINGLGSPTPSPLDLNCSGSVDLADLYQVMLEW